MYSLRQAKKAVGSPVLLIREGIRLFNHFRQGTDFYADGVDVLSEDWDTLVVLDACRYDEFERVNTELDGRLERRRSRGTTSPEFVRGNFRNRTVHDTVCVSANGYYSLLRDQLDLEFHAYIGLHDDDHRDAADGITTRPETVTDRAIAAHEEYPRKRLIVHYLQPHQPFLETDLEHGAGMDETIRLNDLSRTEVRAAYRANLELVLSEVSRLVGHVDGKTVVTSDHGELLGERLPYVGIRDYGHPEGVYVPELLDVPWFEVARSDGDRRVIESDEPVGMGDVDMSAVKADLEDLGYRV